MRPAISLEIGMVLCGLVMPPAVCMHLAVLAKCLQNASGCRRVEWFRARNRAEV